MIMVNLMIMMVTKMVEMIVMIDENDYGNDDDRDGVADGDNYGDNDDNTEISPVIWKLDK